MSFCIDFLLVGQARPFGHDGESSAIVKTSVEGPRFIGRLGVEGDAQADLTVHGGVDKAIHHYPRDHYPNWLARLGRITALGAPGAFGENISTLGVVETEVCVGDRFRLGSALVEIAQGRQPCWKQAHRFDNPNVVAMMVKSGESGWYYRVIEPGKIRAGDMLTLVDRPHLEWNVARVTGIIVGGTSRDEPGAIRALADLAVLAEGWRMRAGQIAERLR